MPVHELCRVYIEQISLLDEKIGGLDKEIQHRAKTDEGGGRGTDLPYLIYIDIVTTQLQPSYNPVTTRLQPSYRETTVNVT